MMESTPVTAANLQEERAKMERRSMHMRKQCQRLCEESSANDLPSIAGLKEEALDTQDVLNSLHEIMTSIQYRYYPSQTATNFFEYFKIVRLFDKR